MVNLRTAAYWRVRQLVLDRGLLLPRERELEEELLAQSYIETSSGELALESKLEIRKRLGRSLNRSDALAYAAGRRPDQCQGWGGGARGSRVPPERSPEPYG